MTVTSSIINTPIRKLGDFYSKGCLNLSNRKMSEEDFNQMISYIKPGMEIKKLDLSRFSFNKEDLASYLIALIILCIDCTTTQSPLTVDARGCTALQNDKGEIQAGVLEVIELGTHTRIKPKIIFDKKVVEFT